MQSLLCRGGSQLLLLLERILNQVYALAIHEDGVVQAKCRQLAHFSMHGCRQKHRLTPGRAGLLAALVEEPQDAGCNAPT
jgi:hypothetical protein